ncbi:DUF924 family protein [Enhydrobacter sp.]|uniref:DUF924 family protein n=1 Tax=Enhydrobacter sp. TaxID=1894999 RepID=UPI00261B595F|nr:DUF924 family protein [Enhydrobacter sp.]WIM14240.1 MAG: putative transmembrane protein [Enhydrobacter sp.]
MTASIAGFPGPPDALAILDFWRQAGPAMWFAKDDAFDRRFRDSFLRLYRAAERGDLSSWLETPEGALALVLLLDQFPRNAFRGTPAMYATDTVARKAARSAIEAGHDRAVPADLAVFFYLPFGHSESIADQRQCLALTEWLDEQTRSRARHHHDIVQRFGRFPHRNAILGRTTTAEEQRYLDSDGYKG